jgi:hypothetical protein
MWFSERSTSDSHVYKRSLPSGGYIAIATQPVQPLFGAAPKIRGHIVVERRSEERRVGHAPPIVAVAEHEDVNALIEALVPVAESDEILNRTLAQRVTVPVRRSRFPTT